MQVSIEGIQEFVRKTPRVRPVGGGTKPALSARANLPLRSLSGVLEYEPDEYTFTALAGTTVAEVQQLLAQHGQYLPLDPPFAEAGSTLGGTVAAGLSGPGRLRFGGVRDFLLGVRFVTGDGELVSGGGKVVKNAAGFDLPKLVVGSLGRYGVLVELTFKVFPRPEAYATLVVDVPDLGESIAAMQSLASSPLELACLDFTPPGRLYLRVGGIAEVLPKRMARLQELMISTGACEVLSSHEDESLWQQARAFGWVPAKHGIVKVPLVAQQIHRLEQGLATLRCNVPRRYSAAGSVAWLAWPESLPSTRLETVLQGLARPGLALTGNWDHPLLGEQRGNAFAQRILEVLDPEGKFQPDPKP